MTNLLRALLLTVFGGVLWGQAPPTCTTGLDPATVCRVTLTFNLTGEIYDQVEAARTGNFIDDSNPANPTPIHATVEALLQDAIDRALVEVLRLQPTAAVRSALADLRSQEDTTEQEIQDSLRIGR